MIRGFLHRLIKGAHDLNYKSLTNEQLREGRMIYSAKAYGSYVGLCTCICGGIVSNIASYVVGFALGLGTASSDISDESKEKICENGYKIVKYGGMALFGSLGTFFAIRSGRYFRKSFLCNKELNVRFDKKFN